MIHKASKDTEQVTEAKAEIEARKRKEVDEALAAAWDEIAEGAQR